MRAADAFYPNLKNALIDEDVRGLRRVQGLVLLRFFAYRRAKTAFFESLFWKYYLLNGEDFIDNLYFESNTNLFPKQEVEKLIMLNLDFDDKKMNKEYFKNAILKCVKNKEENQTNL